MVLQKYQSLAEALIEKAVKKGAQEAEVYIINSRDFSVEVSQGEVETLKTAENQGIGIRIVADKKMGFAYSSDLTDDVLQDTVDRAVENALNVAPDDAYTLPEKVQSYPDLKLHDEKIVTTPVEQKIEIAKDIERYAKEYDSRIKITESCTYQDSEYNIVIANSNGLMGGYQASYCGTYAYLVAEENGESQTGFAVHYSLNYDNLEPKKVGEEAAEKAVRMLGAKTIKTQKATIVLDPYIATNFLGVIAPALSAEAVQKGKSLFANKLEKEVAATNVNIIDDGKMQGGILSSPFDGEGIPTQKTVLIKNGKLKTYLYNTYTAVKDGVSSTGNATRGSFKSTPEVGTTNFYIDKGSITKEQLIGNINKGFYVTEVMGMHTANPISGDFSVGAAGIWIEDGEFTKPVRGVTIAGNILELLKSIEAVADDLIFFVGKGAPTIQIAKMTISGS